MATLNPSIIKDTKKLISSYQNSFHGNKRFSNAFDKILAKNINATYLGRPVKLYIEVLTKINIGYKQDYDRIRKIGLHDTEGKVGQLFKKVRPNDFYLLDTAALTAQQGLNYTSYSAQDIEQINKIENNIKNKDYKEKGAAHIKRIDEATEAEKQAEEQPVPGSSPENKKSYNPASQEETARLQKAINQREAENLKNEQDKTRLVGPSGEPIRHLPQPQGETQTSKEISKNILVGIDGRPIRNIQPEPQIEIQTSNEPVVATTSFSEPQSIIIESTESPQETPQTSSSFSNPTSFVRNFFKKGSISEEAGAKLATGRAAAFSAGKIATKVGINTTIKTAALIAKIGISAATGLATAGLSIVVTAAISLATTYGGQIISLGKTLVKVTIATVCAFLLMFFWNWGEKMNAFLPPYTIGYAEPLPSISPSISPNPSISPTANLRQKIIDQFNIYFNGFDNNQLQWAYNMLSKFSQTNFINLTKGTTITAVEGHDSKQTGCRTLDLGNKYGSEEVFDVILTHELSHIIWLCNSGEVAHLIDHTEAWNNEGGVTSYSRTGCMGTAQKTEDYAEMLTYYLNPTSNTISANCAEQQANPYLSGGYPQHKRVAEMILGRYP